MAWTEPRTWVTGEVLSKTNLDIQVRDNLNCLKTNIALEAAVELTISSGAVTKSRAHHKIDTEADAASDDLVTISGGAEGEVVLIRPANGARTIVLKHNTGNLWLPGGVDLTLDDADDYALLVYSGSKWTAIGGGGETDPVFSASEAASFAAGDKTKLDGIEPGADVTDAANVAAAGAVMESDFTAKGDLISASAANTPDALHIGTDGQVLTAHADHANGLGMAWETPVAGFSIERLADEPALQLSKMYHNTTSHKLFYCKEDA